MRRVRPPAIACARWLDHLSAHLPIARAGEDPEGVHQVRVAVARLRVWLILGGRRILRDDLAWLRKHAATVRDLDVHLTQGPPTAIERHLRKERAAAYGELQGVLDDPRLQGLLRALALLPAVPSDEARRRTAKLADAALARAHRALRRPDDASALHAVRCAVRRVRYALEWLEQCPPKLAELQDAFGAVEDRWVALRHLERVPHRDHGLATYRRKLEHELDQHSRQARRLVRDCEPMLKEIAQWSSS